MADPAYHHAHYLAHKESYVARARQHDAAHLIRCRRFLTAYKSYFGCQRCAVVDVRVLECHHLGAKVKNIGDVLSRRWSLRRIVQELLKCEILCANCHRIETLS